MFTCPFCDGWEHQDRHLAVVGDPMFVPHLAKMLLGWTDRVSVFGVELPDETASELLAAGVVVDPRSVRKVVGDGTEVDALELQDGTTAEVGGVFHARLPLPNTALAVELGCELGDYGFVVADEMRRTTVPGVWAVGDVARTGHQMAFAIADGVTAGSLVHAHLMA